MNDKAEALFVRNINSTSEKRVVYMVSIVAYRLPVDLIKECFHTCGTECACAQYCAKVEVHGWLLSSILCCSFLTLRLVANKINSKRFGARLSHRLNRKCVQEVQVHRWLFSGMIEELTTLCCSFLTLV